MLARLAVFSKDRDAGADFTPVRVLIVDDDRDFRSLCNACLTQRVPRLYDVVEAASAMDAIEHFRAGNFDCVLIAYRLPEMFGTELISQLRDNERCSVPLIVLTSVGSEDIAMEAIHAGAADYIPKHQVDSNSLDRAVWYSVEKSRLQKSVLERTQELISALDELEKKNFELRRFYHTVSHEIKTPLSSAREFSALILDGVMGEVNEQQTTALGYVIEGCDQIARHFDDLIAVARSDTGKMIISRSRVSVESIIDRSVSGVLPAVSRKRITLERFDVDGLPGIEVDGFRIAQVVSNLLANAVECSADRGRINISAERAEDDQICIVVQDFGKGINAEDLPRIFDRLFQGHVELHSTHGGMGLGLGLSIAREIVALHSGRIEVESDPGAGSTFFVYLPINAPQESVAASQSVQLS